MTRDFNGYKQVKNGRKWQFIILGFDSTTSGEAGYCSVMLSNNEGEQVPIDPKDRILINGKRYGRAHWYH